MKAVAKRWHRLNGKAILSCVAEPALHDPIEVQRSTILDTYILRGVWFG